MSEKTVGDWMHKEVVTCTPDTSAEAVAKLMKAADMSTLVVVGEDGEVVGVITRMDLVNSRFVEPQAKDAAGIRAEHLMSWPVVCVTPTTPIAEAARVMSEKRIHRLVVVEQDSEQAQPVGILSITDLAKHADEKLD
ncbi:MAG: CBS domain-containing protein [Deltaproteobacteria bacterium]|nr:CBS domain-containing protein [Deltaproteobacteria bacterium]